MKYLYGNSASTIGSEKEEGHWATVVREGLMVDAELNLAFESVI